MGDLVECIRLSTRFVASTSVTGASGCIRVCAGQKVMGSRVVGIAILLSSFVFVLDVMIEVEFVDHVCATRVHHIQVENGLGEIVSKYLNICGVLVLAVDKKSWLSCQIFLV